ncbi:MAG TPA: 23S rRNA (guanosine(2251)-2'-O)-methyltransferase RlmB [Desulfuromonadales bacterium]|nr:23S rRNA (guanosine(2251)-2'-O)-methyltransferase RlmB [Desulfuromonadales bacterium]
MADWIYGVNPVQEALSGSRRRPLEVLVVRDGRSARLEGVLRTARSAGIPVREAERAELTRMAGHPHHQGVLLRVAPFDYIPLEDLLARWRETGRPGLFLVLDGITDPHNFGALLRDADAAGCQGVIVPKDRACPVTAVVEKSAAGALSHLPLCQVTNISRTLDTLKAEGIWVYGLAGDEGATDLYQADLQGDVALVIGSEGGGLRLNSRRHSDLLLSIPMSGGVTSLNASAAAAVALFEAVRQRRSI